jgi:hypothetical protein
MREARPERLQKAAPYVQRVLRQLLRVADERIGFRCLVGNTLNRSLKCHLGPPFAYLTAQDQLCSWRDSTAWRAHYGRVNPGKRKTGRSYFSG